jgi:uncharacterized protein
MESRDEETRKLLEDARLIAIVGLSPDKEKASNIVAGYLIKAGYRIVPVNPRYEEILGAKSYRSLSDIPGTVDIVDIFMRAENVPPVVEEAVGLKPKAVWLQLGIVSEEAEDLARKNGILYRENVCIKQEHTRLFPGKA